MRRRDSEQALEGRHGARDGRGHFRGVDVLGHVGEDLDDVLEEAAGALVAVVFAEDAEEEGGAEGAVDCGPGAGSEGGHVLEAKEGFDCVCEAVDACLA